MPVRDLPERFLVAFSFAGEQRNRVRAIAEAVEARLGRSRVFLDEWYEYYIAGDDSDLTLQELYSNRCVLAVVCVSEHYGGKSWTQTEHRAIRARLMRSREQSANDRGRLGILPIRVGDGDIEGIPFNTIVPDVRLKTLEETVELIIERLRLIDPNLLPSHSPPPNGGQCPYPGLRPFTSNESVFFFGREDETDELMKKLSNPNCRFVAIVGTSGTGKSSLVYAGLLPRLTADASEGNTAWRVVSFKPGSLGNNPFLPLAAALRPLLSNDTVIEPFAIATDLKDTPAKITDYVKAITEASSTQLVLFVDQLEELFTQAQNAYREGFIDLLTKAARYHRVRVLATLRDHSLHQVLRYPELATWLQTGTLVLGPPGRPAFAKMIRCPAERVHVELEDELVRKILDDAGSDAGALPLVAFCLNELCYQSAGRMTLAAYESMGGLFEAISQHAKKLLEDWQPREGVNAEAALKTIFWTLVTVDTNGTVFRRHACLDVFDTAVRDLVEKLINGRLLITVITDALSARAGNCATVELAHAALLDKWPTLNDWIAQNRPYILLRDDLVRAMDIWLKAPEGKGSLLWKGRKLKEARRLLKDQPYAFQTNHIKIDNVRQFIKASTIKEWMNKASIEVLGAILVMFTVVLIVIMTNINPRGTMPVGLFDSNGFKLHDVVGNVWEWTDDCFGNCKNMLTDGSASAGNDHQWCVARGGSWDNHEQDRVSVTYRLALERQHEGPTVGFRVVRDQVPNDNNQKPLQEFKDCEVCPTMVTIPRDGPKVRALPSKGCPEGERSPEIKPLAVGKYEVTVAEWHACVQSNGGCEKRPLDKNWSDTDDRPANFASWKDAVTYVKWLRNITSKNYRLPTHAEWEYAARGGAEGCWPWGDKFEKYEANCAACGLHWKHVLYGLQFW
jgi:formylglycine-generating enzyme required for sulfatase activity